MLVSVRRQSTHQRDELQLICLQETEQSEAEQICEAHGQKLWMYAPKRSYQPFSYWICSKPQSNEVSYLI